MSQNPAPSEKNITAGDWVMAVISFLSCFFIVPIFLSVYNFARSRNQKGILYLSVVGLQLFVLIILVIAKQ